MSWAFGPLLPGGAQLLATVSAYSLDGTGTQLTLTGGTASFALTVAATGTQATLAGGTADLGLTVDLIARPRVTWVPSGGVYRQSWSARIVYDQLSYHAPAPAVLTYSLDGTGSLLTLTGAAATLDLSLAGTGRQLTLAGGAATGDLSLPATGSALALTGGTAYGNLTLAAAGSALVLTGGVAYGDITLAATGSSLALTGGTAAFGLTLGATGVALTLTGGDAAFALGGDFNLDGTGATLALVGGTGTFDLSLNATGGALSLVGGLATFDVVGVQPAQQTQAGRGRRRRRKYVVSIDGQDFATESLEEATALLDRAKVLAVRQSQERAAEVVEQAIAKARRVGKAEVRVKAPTITAPEELSSQVDAIRQLYRDAAIAAEIQVLMALEAERDDEETILLSL